MFYCAKCESELFEASNDTSVICDCCSARNLIEGDCVYIEDYSPCNDDRKVPNQPQWIGDLTYADCAAIRQGGCDSGAYMPAVTYATALDVMNKWGDCILDYLQDNCGEESIPAPPKGSTWAGIACYYYSYAVELFACIALEVE